MASCKEQVSNSETTEELEFLKEKNDELRKEYDKLQDRYCDFGEEKFMYMKQKYERMKEKYYEQQRQNRDKDLCIKKLKSACNDIVIECDYIVNVNNKFKDTENDRLLDAVGKYEYNKELLLRICEYHQV